MKVLESKIQYTKSKQANPQKFNFYFPLTLTLSPFGERGSRYLPQSAVDGMYLRRWEDSLQRLPAGVPHIVHAGILLQILAQYGKADELRRPQEYVTWERNAASDLNQVSGLSGSWKVSIQIVL